MALTTYTQYSSVRAAMGVAAKELEDSVLADELYVNMLEAELVGIDSNLITNFTAASGESTTAALQLVSAVQVFAAYFVANQCAGVLANISPRSLTDGKSGFARHSNKAYLATVDNIKAGLGKARTTLKSKYDAYAGSATSDETPPAFVRVSNLGTDPVTGT